MTDDTRNTTWVIMPVLSAPDLTEAAISDVLAQSMPTRLLIVNQGVDDQFRDRLERIAEAYPGQVLLWSHMPPLPSLAATWNRALDCVWEAGGTEALVVNNDVRLHRRTLEHLLDVQRATEAFFVTAVGVTEAQFNEVTAGEYFEASLRHDDIQKGGPDFSCFVIAKACHDVWRFDENCIPAFTEDLDYHRRLMLAGCGQLIFSVNMPYLHYASQTLKTIDPKVAARINAEISAVSRAHYRAKWGGDVNAETFYTPFGRDDADVPAGVYPGGPTTPALFDQERSQWARPSTSWDSTTALSAPDPQPQPPPEATPTPEAPTGIASARRSTRSSRPATSRGRKRR